MDSVIDRPVSDRFGFTLFMAIAVHAMAILGIAFTSVPALKPVSTLEITLSQYQSREVPDNADFIAPTNQLGSGSEEQKHLPAVRQHSELQAAEPVELAAQWTATEQPSAEPTPPEPVTRELAAEPERSPEKSSAGGAKVITTVAVSEQQQADKQQHDRAFAPPRPDGGATSLLSRSLEMASLQAQIDATEEWLAKQPRVRRLTSATTKAREDAAYLDSWRRKIEAVGNLNYPEEARQGRTYGQLRLLVALQPDGSVKEISVLSSSGHRVLDDAAIRIVRMAAPFSPFPPQMRRTTDVLEIIRTWKFEQRTRVF
ncbi:MAG: TonB family protein [Marinobacterium sp.]|nr:TonB family protein [Marinobacterium sp.]